MTERTPVTRHLLYVGEQVLYEAAHVDRQVTWSDPPGQPGVDLLSMALAVDSNGRNLVGVTVSTDTDLERLAAWLYATAPWQMFDLPSEFCAWLGMADGVTESVGSIRAGIWEREDVGVVHVVIASVA
jgi:hypothetical protein